MNKSQVDQDFEYWISFAERNGQFPELVAELKNRADEKGRAEAVELLQAVFRMRFRGYLAIATRILVTALLVAATFFVLSKIGG